MEKIRLFREGSRLGLEVFESGESYTILAGFYGYEDNVIVYHGEKYMIRAMAEAVFDRYGNAEYRIELLFPETASVRRIKLKRFDDGRLIIELSESPNNRIAENYLEMYSESSGIVTFVTDMLERRLGEGELSRIIGRVFNPTLVGADMSHPGCEQILNDEIKSKAVEPGTVKIIRVLVNRFFKEKNE